MEGAKGNPNPNPNPSPNPSPNIEGRVNPNPSPSPRPRPNLEGRANPSSILETVVADSDDECNDGEVENNGVGDNSRVAEEKRWAPGRSNKLPKPAPPVPLFKLSLSQSRHPYKIEEYQNLFHLAQDEMLIQDFNCALQSKILLQGHLYLFEHYVCFYSNIFGYEKKKVIPFKDVTMVRKARTAGLFPNALEIVSWGKKNFFTSFLSRDEAYRLIYEKWCCHSRHAKGILGPQVRSVDLENTLASVQYSSRSSSSDSSIESRDSGNHHGESAEVESEVVGLENSEELNDTAGTSENRIVGCTDASDFGWEIEAETPPELPKHYRRLMQCELPVDSKDFFMLFFSNEAAQFSVAVHKKCGDEDFQCKPWTKHHHFGYVREVTFQHPVNYYFGPKAAYCHEVQRYHVYQKGHLIIESSQQMNEVPYGDCFHVEGRWDVENKLDAEGRKYCLLCISLDIPFTKKTIWKGKIEHGTFEECQKVYSIWIEEARALLQKRGIDNNLMTREMKLRDGGQLSSAKNPRERRSSKLESNQNADCQTTKQSGVAYVSESSKQQLNVGNLRGSIERVGTRFSGSANAANNPEAMAQPWGNLNQIFVLFFVAFIILSQAGVIISLTRLNQSHRSCLGDTQKLHHEMKSDQGGPFTLYEQKARIIREQVSVIETWIDSLHHDLKLLKVQLETLHKNNPHLRSTTPNVTFTA